MILLCLIDNKPGDNFLLIKNKQVSTFNGSGKIRTSYDGPSPMCSISYYELAAFSPEHGKNHFFARQVSVITWFDSDSNRDTVVR